jgi:hypothetical protein
MIAGIVLAALGAFILAMGVDDVGDLQVSAEEQRAVPPWVGWAAVVGGVALIGAGVGRRRRPLRRLARTRRRPSNESTRGARGTTSPRSAVR